MVTKESFVSVCWRLIPYWLNNWEQQWGAECSSMMFELPHFAIELLVVLPCVQVHHPRLVTQQVSSAFLLHRPLFWFPSPGEGPPLARALVAEGMLVKEAECDVCQILQILCARLKILALPPGQAAIPPAGAGAAPAQQGGGGRGALAPDILRGGWLPRSRQAQLLPRLKCATPCPATSSPSYDARCARYRAAYPRH